MPALLVIVVAEGAGDEVICQGILLELGGAFDQAAAQFVGEFADGAGRTRRTRRYGEGQRQDQRLGGFAGP
jgi:hypothetical protein